MHIAYLTSHYPFPGAKSVGGIGTSIKSLAEEIRSCGHEVSIFIYGQPEDKSYDNEKGIHFHLIENQKLKGLSWWLTRKKIQKRILSAHSTIPIDLLESPDWEGMTSFIKLPFPIILKLHGSDTYFCHLENRKVKWKNKFHEKKAFRNAAAIISVSAFTGKETNAVFNMNRSITVIPNSVNTHQFLANTEIGENTILYFGGIIRKKGVLEIPAYFNAIHKQFPDTKLIIAGADMPDVMTGSSSTWAMMKALFDEDALRKVLYLGSIPHQSMAAEIEKAAVCIFPSFAEALPISWLEAMAMGKAVVASDIGWSREIIEDESDGLIANPKDIDAFSGKIMLLLQNKSLASALQKNARIKMERNFSTELIAEKNIAAYQKILNNA